MHPCAGTPGGTRTPYLLLRRQLLYPDELLAHVGAGDGNRTRVSSLEGWCSAIELHPQGVNHQLSNFTMQAKLCQGKISLFLHFKVPALHVPFGRGYRQRKSGIPAPKACPYHPII